jgi:drug/metabolite transporter (DMT)-like permease
LSRSGKQANDGLIAALLTPLLMGFAPVLGKLAIHAGFDPYTLAALRTCFAAALLWIVYLLFFRKYIYIFPAGLLGTLVVGAVNGFGSLLYYNGLLLLDNASIAQLLQMLYVIFALLLVRIYGQRISVTSVVRTGMALLAVYLLTAWNETTGTVHWIGVALMIGSAFMYALHVVLSQRVMWEMPAPTMALYALTWMGVVVLLAWLISGASVPVSTGPQLTQGWLYILALTAVTALSRVTLFSGVRNIGSLQTILLNVAEIGVTLVAAITLLGEHMQPIQWVGVVVLLFSVLLSRWDDGFKDISVQPISGAMSRLPPFTDPKDPNA